MRVREREVNLGAISEIESNVGVHGLGSGQPGRRQSVLVLQPEGPFSFFTLYYGSKYQSLDHSGEQSEERGRIELHLLEGRAYSMCVCYLKFFFREDLRFLFIFFLSLNCLC